jgi:hypothetical protein
MSKQCLGLCVAVCWFAAFSASGQEVVHSLTGTIKSVNSSAGTIEVNTDDGSEGLFKDMTKSHVSVNVDRKFLAELVPAAGFTSKGPQTVIVFYYGDNAVRTAVGLLQIGMGPLETNSGNVARFDKHAELLTVQTSSGGEKTFQISSKTVAETSVGAVLGRRFTPEKGEQIRVISSSENGKDIARYVYAK